MNKERRYLKEERHKVGRWVNILTLVLESFALLLYVNFIDYYFGEDIKFIEGYIALLIGLVLILSIRTVFKYIRYRLSKFYNDILSKKSIHCGAYSKEVK